MTDKHLTITRMAKELDKALEANHIDFFVHCILSQMLERDEELAKTETEYVGDASQAFRRTIMEFLNCWRGESGQVSIQENRYSARRIKVLRRQLRDRMPNQEDK